MTTNKFTCINYQNILIFIFSFQLVIFGLIGLDAIGFHIPIIRSLVSFVYLLFIPGTLILRILRIDRVNNIEMLLYTVGLSISTLMFTGFFINTVYPFFGITRPISTLPLTVSLSLVILGLCIISKFSNNEGIFKLPSINLNDFLSVPVLFLCVIPFLSIFGTYLVNFHKNNVLLMFMIFLIVLIVVLIGYDKFISPRLYPFTIFVITISLLFHNSLISNYIWGWDIHSEYYLSNLVINNSTWDSSISSNVNAMLSVVIFTPIFSIFSGMDIIWIFKIIYPLIFSLVPLGMYEIIRKQTQSEKISFLSVFFFISLFVFYTEMLQLVRQQIAELYVVLILLLIVDSNIKDVSKSIMLILFGFSIIVSHYGLSYIFMGSLIALKGLIFLDSQIYHKEIKEQRINRTFVLLFVTFAISWYLYISSSSALNTVVLIADHIISSIATDFLNPQSAQGLSIIIMNTMSPLQSLNKYIHIITQFFISVGIFDLLIRKNNMNFNKEYFILCILYFALLIASIAVPYLGSSLNVSRLYQISLIFLAPFCIIGGIVFLKISTSLIKITLINNYKKEYMKLLSLFLVGFLLLNTGFMYEVTDDDQKTSISLSNVSDYPYFNEQEIICANWLSNKNTNPAYADNYRSLLLRGIMWGEYNVLQKHLPSIPKNSNVFIGTYNILTNRILVPSEVSTNNVEYVDIKIFTNSREKIYENGGAQVYA